MIYVGRYSTYLSNYDSNLDCFVNHSCSVAKVWDKNTAGGLYNLLDEDMFGELVLDRGFFD